MKPVPATSVSMKSRPAAAACGADGGPAGVDSATAAGSRSDSHRDAHRIARIFIQGPIDGPRARTFFMDTEGKLATR